MPNEFAIVRKPEIQLHVTMGPADIDEIAVSRNDGTHVSMALDDSATLSFTGDQTQLSINYRVRLWPAPLADQYTSILEGDELPRTDGPPGAELLISNQDCTDQPRQIYLQILRVSDGWTRTIQFTVTSTGSADIEIQPRYNPPAGTPPPSENPRGPRGPGGYRGPGRPGRPGRPGGPGGHRRSGPHGMATDRPGSHPATGDDGGGDDGGNDGNNSPPASPANRSRPLEMDPSGHHPTPEDRNRRH